MKLLETKEGIMRVAKELKESTRKLCRQLQKKPDVEGNQKEAKLHKKSLEETVQSLIEDLTRDNSSNNYANTINKEIERSSKFDVLRIQEKDLTNKIRKVTEDYKKAQTEYVREQDDNNIEIADLKKRVNEADVESKLHIQYLERQIQGAQSCRDRLYKQQETALLEEIKALEIELGTENEVNKSVKDHLAQRQGELNKKAQETDDKMENERKKLETEKTDIKDNKTAAQMEMQRIVEDINKDNEDRKRREDLDKEKDEEEQAKVQEKMSMEDAARFIQRKWGWF